MPEAAAANLSCRGRTSLPVSNPFSRASDYESNWCALHRACCGAIPCYRSSEPCVVKFRDAWDLGPGPAAYYAVSQSDPISTFLDGFAPSFRRRSTIGAKTMWLALRYGFFSVACAQRKDGSLDPDTLIGGARCREHVSRLQRRLPSLADHTILATPKADYRTGK